ncbi:MAG: hypothetical protein H0V93_06170 [Euzebyales bacterium]|nr:hypothetical protein [Euzebyales bacterium]
MSTNRASVPIDPTLYEQTAAAASEGGSDTAELVEQALRRTLALRAQRELQASSPWRELSEDAVMDLVVTEQKVARAGRTPRPRRGGRAVGARSPAVRGHSRNVNAPPLWSPLALTVILVSRKQVCG